MRKSTTVRHIALPFALLLTACGSEGLDWASTEQGIAPAGSAAVEVSNTIPTTVAAGERLNVSVRMRNTGAASPANDWDTNYRFTNLGGGFSFGYIRVPAAAVPVEAGILEEQDFNFVITAPASGSQTFIGQMYTDTPGSSGAFGPQVSVPVTVSTDPNFLRRWDCSAVTDTLPATMTPGERRTITVTVRNAGTNDWAPGTLCLYARDTPFTLWGGVYCSTLTTAAAGATQLSPGTGGTATFTFPITAPTTEGTYTFRRQMFGPTTNGGVGFFDTVNPCVDRSILVTSGATVPYASTFEPSLSNIDDGPMATWQPSERRRVTVSMRNSGINTWTDNGASTFLLYSLNTPSTLWKPVPYSVLLVDTPTNSTNSFVFYARAPATPGSYNNRWRMWSNQAVPNYFGETVDFPVTVDGASPLQLDAVIDSAIVPATVNRLSPVQFRITVRNTGFLTWDSSEFELLSVGSPYYTWSTVSVPLPNGTQVPPGGTFEFVVNGTSPSTPGSYQSNWQMRTSLGGFTFGAISTNNVNVVANCGNGVTNAGEQCDDGNQTSGDGCSSVCQLEAVTVDLANVNAADRTLYGVQSARDLSAVAIGDLNGDGVPDVAVGAYSTVTATTPARALAGEVFVHSGIGFLSSNETSADTGDMLHVIGARTYDQLGGGASGSIKIADVTGDTRPDLIISSAFAACSDGMNSCGRIYVIRGGTTTNFPSGVLDLAAPPASVVAQIVAPTDGDGAIVLAVGDLTGDGIADIVMGSPQANGTRGRVTIIAGGAGLTGTIVASNANVVAEFLGAGLDDQLGQVAAIGQLDGVGNNDLLLGSGRHDPATGGLDAGGAWAFFAPHGGTRDLQAGAFNVAWLGAGVRDRVGSSLNVADVTGDGSPDALIGTNGTRFAPNTRYGTVDIWSGPFVTATTLDLGLGANPDFYFQGRVADADFGKCTGTGDVNGDGQLDVFGVSFLATGATGTVIQAGELGVMLGGPSIASQQLSPGTTPIVVQGGQDRGRMCMYPRGLAIADLDGDGRADFCVASPQATVPASGLFNEGRVDCILSPF